MVKVGYFAANAADGTPPCVILTIAILPLAEMPGAFRWPAREKWRKPGE